jgi:pilus assembly protein CpaC
MKCVLLICVISALPIVVYGQQTTLSESQPNCQRQLSSHPLNALQTKAQIPEAADAGVSVRVHLKIAEVSLTKLRQMGIDASKLTGKSNTKPTNTAEATSNAQSFCGMNDGREAQELLELLRKQHLAKVLAEPTLVAPSGKMSVFNLGSQLPIPKSNPDGSVGIEHLNEIEVKLTPEVFGDKVRLDIDARVSKSDYEHSVRVGKEDVPGIQSCSFRTHTKFRSGQTLVINGLIQSCEETTNVGVPFIGDLPIIGVMFRKVKEERNEVMTIALIRVEIVTEADVLPNKKLHDKSHPH